jgi:hypothetical protein
MALRDDLIAYHTRRADVEAIIKEERRTATPELRWQQINAAYAIAKGLGLLREDPGEAEVYERWARLKEKAVIRPLKV